jgi:hypothetical protein
MRLAAVAAGAVLAVLASNGASAAEDWTAVERSIAVNAPAEKVWSLIGGYCQANKNRGAPCDFVKGTGGLGTNRKVSPTTEEVKVAEGVYSYGYFQTLGTNTGLRYHGNVSVVPDGKASKIVYTLIYDQGALKDDAERASTAATMGTRFQGAIEQMKAFVEAAK